MSSYLVVFHAKLHPNVGFVDIGDDPCFDPPATWGICRPNMRRSVLMGTNLFFLGYIAPKQYWMKGWFQVGEKISCAEACIRFPTRRNVILSPLPANVSLKRIIRNKYKEGIRWRYPDKEAVFRMSGLARIPKFLFMTTLDSRIFIQNPADDHEIDNWKCSRIFRCRVAQFSRCLRESACSKEGALLEPRYANYIVARDGMCLDVGRRMLPWDEIENEFHFGLNLRTPGGQHNVLRIPEQRVPALIKYLRSIV